MPRSRSNGYGFRPFYAQLIAAKLSVNNATGIPEIDDPEAWMCDMETNSGIGPDTQFDKDNKADKRVAAGYWEDLDFFNNLYECD